MNELIEAKGRERRNREPKGGKVVSLGLGARNDVGKKKSIGTRI